MAPKDETLLRDASANLLSLVEEASTPEAKLRVRAAICALSGDAQGALQHLQASKIPQEDWEKAQRGELDY